MKKLLSLILSILMLLTMVTPAFAADTAGYKVYTNAEYVALNLETPLIVYFADTALVNQGITVEKRLDTTPQKYLFKTADTTDTKEYVLLKSVNAKEGDGYFVLVNEKTDHSGNTPYNTVADKYIFDVADTGSVAYKMNQDSYINQYFPLMKNYINTHRWYTEPRSDAKEDVYSTDAKIALPSLTEYAQNYDRIGVKFDAGTQWRLRTPHNQNKTAWCFLSNSKKIDAGSAVTSTYTARYNRPCFYLNENFFKEVKLDMTYLTTEDSEAAKIIKNIASTEEGLAALNDVYTAEELIEIGIAAGNVEITSATITGTGECDKTLVANVTTNNAATTTEYEWIKVAADGTETILDSVVNSYKVKFADLGASIKCFVKVYEGETLSHSAYTNTVVTEAKPTFPSYTSVTLTGTAADGVKNTPEQYKFSVDGREMILLKSVNANADDGQFVTLEVPVSDTSIVYYDVADATEFNALTKVIYDPEDSKSMAYDVNKTSFWDKETKSNTAMDKTAKVIPDSVRPYLNTHRWWNEGINNTELGYTQDAWATESKAAILSYTEYRENIDRIGYVDENGCAMLTRTARYDSTSVSATATNPQVAAIGSSEYAAGTTKYRFTQIGVTAGKETTYLYWHSKPVSFYLNPDFFANVAVDFTEENTEVIAILREKLAGKTKVELIDMGYSYSDIKILFPALVSDINDVEMYDFTATAGENGNYTITYMCENTTDSDITFKPLAAAYADLALVDSYLATEDITLKPGEPKMASFTVNIGTKTASDILIKTFVWNIEEVMPIAPCADVYLATLGNEP
ncbi:MAG: hypothetical protein E7404_07580 [Ruminococcaceae bacterium]|nr:hypothetical protein [Oscillospiraceae bacterium]